MHYPPHIARILHKLARLPFDVAVLGHSRAEGGIALYNAVSCVLDGIHFTYVHELLLSVIVVIVISGTVAAFGSK